MLHVWFHTYELTTAVKCGLVDGSASQVCVVCVVWWVVARIKLHPKINMYVYCKDVCTYAIHVHILDDYTYPE